MPLCLLPLGLDFESLSPVLRGQQAQKLKAAELDSWLGGGFWRLIQTPNSKHCAVVKPETTCSLSLAVDHLPWYSHAACPYCTRGVAFGLDFARPADKQFNPLFLLAGSSHFPSDLSCVVKEHCAFRFYNLHVETTRVVMLSSDFYRAELWAAAHP